MQILNRKPIVRLIVAMLVAVAVVGLGAVAIHAPTQTASPLTLKSIQTNKATMFYTNHRRNAIWFVEAVLPGTDNKAAAKTLETLAATL